LFTPVQVGHLKIVILVRKNYERKIIFFLNGLKCTMVFGGSEIWLKILENFCTKTCQFIRKKRDKNGPQLIRIVP